jgi:hypothetical protein
MIFRSEFLVTEKLSRTVERDNRHISGIIGHCCNQMSDDEKNVWHLKAEQEKAPRSFSICEDIRTIKFTPVSRAAKPRKRNVKRADKDEVL